jgi:Flp pilus assembly pilin Flp
MTGKFFRKLLKINDSSRGATLIEYVLVATLLSIALIGGYRTIGNSYTKIYCRLGNAI